MEELSNAAKAYVAFCCNEQTPPRVGELAARMGVTRFRLALNFRQQHGITLGTYLKHLQLARAMELLRTTELTIDAIAQRAAFGSRRSFERAFVRLVGMTPTQHRRACHKVVDG